MACSHRRRGRDNTVLYCRVGGVDKPVEERCTAISLSVCLRVCLSASISLESLDRSSQIFCADPLWLWLGSPLAVLRYVMYFQFMDVVTFGCNGPYGDAWKAEPLT